MKTKFRSVRDPEGKITATIIKKNGLSIYVWPRHRGGKVGQIVIIGGKLASMPLSRGYAKRLLATV